MAVIPPLTFFWQLLIKNTRRRTRTTRRRRRRHGDGAAPVGAVAVLDFNGRNEEEAKPGNMATPMHRIIARRQA